MPLLFEVPLVLALVPLEHGNYVATNVATINNHTGLMLSTPLEIEPVRPGGIRPDRWRPIRPASFPWTRPQSVRLDR
jgi:hypothetical protein